MSKREPATERKMRPVEEPIDRAIYRSQCRSYGYTGSCYKYSGMYGPTLHITMACDGNCRRMKLYDSKNGLKGQEFKLHEFY